MEAGRLEGGHLRIAQQPILVYVARVKDGVQRRHRPRPQDRGGVVVERPRRVDDRGGGIVKDGGNVVAPAPGGANDNHLNAPVFGHHRRLRGLQRRDRVIRWHRSRRCRRRRWGGSGLWLVDSGQRRLRVGADLCLRLHPTRGLCASLGRVIRR